MTCSRQLVRRTREHYLLSPSAGSVPVRYPKPPAVCAEIGPGEPKGHITFRTHEAGLGHSINDDKIGHVRAILSKFRLAGVWNEASRPYQNRGGQVEMGGRIRGALKCSNR